MFVCWEAQEVHRRYLFKVQMKCNSHVLHRKVLFQIHFEGSGKGAGFPRKRFTYSDLGKIMKIHWQIVYPSTMKNLEIEPVAGQVWSAFCEVPRGLYCVLLQWRQRGDPVIQKIHKTSGWKRSDFTGKAMICNDGFLGVPLMKKNTPTNSLLIYSYSIGIAWDDPPWLYCRHNFMSVPGAAVADSDTDGTDGQRLKPS